MLNAVPLSSFLNSGKTELIKSISVLGRLLPDRYLDKYLKVVTANVNKGGKDC